MDVQHNVALAQYTSLHVGGPAENLVQASGAELQSVLASSAKPYCILGDGTNCLISDKGLPGTVVLNRGGTIQVVEPTVLKVDSGVSWDQLVQKTIELGLYGLEFSSGVPGNVGAAVAGNIAAYGHRVSDRLLGATILDTKTGTVTSWDNAAFNFDYRSSSLQRPEHQHCVVLDATFELSASPTSQLEYDSALSVAEELGILPDSLENRRAIILEVRKRAGSLMNDKSVGPWTAGSFFKNPVINESQVDAILSKEEHGVTKEQLLRQNKIHSGNSVRVSSAHVLLAAGFKRGQTWGNVRLHKDHILKVENIGNASAQEIYDVIQTIIKTVKEKLGITLEPEVRFLGEFTN